MKLFSTLLLFTFGNQTIAEPQLWALTFPEKYRDYYLDKFREGDEKAIASINSNLERLIEEGTLTEFERINSGENGKKFPTIKPTEENPFSTYKLKREDPTFRVFYVSRPSPDKSLILSLHGELGKLWTPSAYIKEDDLDVLILEREPEAEKEFVPPAFESRFDVESPYEATYLWMTSEHPEELKKRAPDPEDFSFYCLHQYQILDAVKSSIIIGSSTSVKPLGNNNWEGYPNMDLAKEKGSKLVVEIYSPPVGQGTFQGDELKSSFSFVEQIYDLKTLTILDETIENPKKRGKWTATMRSLKN